jgi:hypothetical protein
MAHEFLYQIWTCSPKSQGMAKDGVGAANMRAVRAAAATTVQLH